VEQIGVVVTEAIRLSRQGERQYQLLDELLVQGMVPTRQAQFDEEELTFKEESELARSLPYTYTYAEARNFDQLDLLGQ
jgi:hypothetical protein